jgi:hypothetical protein
MPDHLWSGISISFFTCAPPFPACRFSRSSRDREFPNRGRIRPAGPGATRRGKAGTKKAISRWLRILLHSVAQPSGIETFFRCFFQETVLRQSNLPYSIPGTRACQAKIRHLKNWACYFEEKYSFMGLK